MRRYFTYRISIIVFSLCWLTIGLQKAKAVTPEDSLQLVEIYNDLDGANWVETWDLAQPVETWFGVQLNGDKTEITSIILIENNLSGTLPSIALPDLIYFDISKNNITGEIPILDLPNIRVLVLTSNFFEGSIPAQLGDLTTLTNLSLTSNQITGNIPSTFGNLENVTNLRLGGNQISGSLPAEMGNMASLSQLIISVNQLTGSIPDEFENLSNLESLFLRDNQLTGPIPAFLGNMISLKQLDLSGNELIGMIPAELGNLMNLTTLSLNRNNLIGGIPESLGNLINLSLINLSNNGLTGDISPSFGNWSLLNFLFFGSNELTGSIPETFGNLSNARTINLNENSLTGMLPATLGNLQSMTVLEVSDNNFTGPIPSSFSNLVELQAFFADNNNLSGELPTFENTLNLNNLNLSYNNFTGPIPDWGHLNILGLVNLSFTQLSGCYPLWTCEVGSFIATGTPGLPYGGSDMEFISFCENPSFQFGSPCNDSDSLTVGEVIQPDCSCSTSNSFTNFVEGQMYYDSLENCEIDNGELELRLEGWMVTASNGTDVYYDVTDSLGQYKIFADTGLYVFQVEVPNAYWGVCPGIQSSPLAFDSLAETLMLDVPIQANYDCSIMNVDIGTPFLRRCFENNYRLFYRNEGTVAAEDAYIEVYFDEYIVINSSNPPWTSREGQLLTYDLGDVPLGGTGRFDINVIVDCDSTVLGQTHCVEAHVFPDSICLPPNTFWDGSTITVEGECDQDSVHFTISNSGLQNMEQTLSYIIIEDDLIDNIGTFLLEAQESSVISIKSSGATYRMEAQQAPNHPTNTAPSATVEGCVESNMPFSLGFVNVFSEDDADPFISIDCQANIGAYDPNDKTGYPFGLGTSHLIDTSTTLEYKIRFQNTGTDTAFYVSILDTISTHLNASTIRMGAASHDYNWNILADNVLQINFDNIMLPDSNINEVASHGFVKFKIDQQSSNPPGTIINNKAAIYFDFNPPIITNQTDHMIEDKLIVYDTLNQAFCNHWFYQNDTSFTLHAVFEYYEIFQYNSIDLLEEEPLVIDTLLNFAEAYQGVFYDSDTTLVQTYTSSEGCDSTVIVNLGFLTGLKEINSNVNVQIQPNPFSENIELILNIDEAIELSQLKVYNGLGQAVLVKTLNRIFNNGQHSIPIDLKNLPDGIYWISLAGSGLTTTKKIIKRE